MAHIDARIGSDSGPPIATPVVLADGTEATVRVLGASDRASVEKLFATASAADLYTRFFAVGSHVVARHIEHVFSLDIGTVTYVVEHDRELLGIADVEPVGPQCAEVAFLVADGAHGLGIATLLLERAADDAWKQGITMFVADVLATNHPMIVVFQDAGLELDLVSHREGVSVRMSTCRTPEAIAATAARHAAALARRGE